MSHANRQALKAGRARTRVGSVGLVGVRLSLTPEENERLLALVRYAANEPADVDHTILLSICHKVEAAQAHPNK